MNLIKTIIRYTLYVVLPLCFFAVFYYTQKYIPIYNGYNWVERPEYMFVDGLVRVGIVIVGLTLVVYVSRQNN